MLRRSQVEYCANYFKCQVILRYDSSGHIFGQQKCTPLKRVTPANTSGKSHLASLCHKFKCMTTYCFVLCKATKDSKGSNWQRVLVGAGWSLRRLGIAHSTFSSAHFSKDWSLNTRPNGMHTRNVVCARAAKHRAFQTSGGPLGRATI